MSLSPTIVTACLLWSVTAAQAELPQYAVTKVQDFFPALGPSQGEYGTGTFVLGVSAGGNNYHAIYADYLNPVTPPGNSFVTPAQTTYVVSSSTLNTLIVGNPPAGFVTGTSGAVFASSAGHVVASVIPASDRNTPGWEDRIQVGRTGPDGITVALPGQGIEQRGVNALGMVIGIGADGSSAWRFKDVGGWQNLGSLNGSGFAQAKGINDSGVVVGVSGNSGGNQVPFIYADGVGMEAITDAGAPVFGQASAINNNGLVTGTANGRAFVFNAATLEFKFITEAATAWKAVDINNAGAIIGASRIGGDIAGTPVDAAFYWEDTMSEAISLDALIGDEVQNWFITDASDINDQGWILATGFDRVQRSYHQVLLRPIPEPSATLMAAASGLWWLARRRRTV